VINPVSCRIHPSPEKLFQALQFAAPGAITPGLNNIERIKITFTFSL